MTDVPADAESSVRLEALVARMASGESIAAIRRGLLPSSWTPVLSRVAVAGRFDQGVYDGLLASGPDAPPLLGTLTDAGLIVPVPGRPGWFSMPAEDRVIWSAELEETELRTLESLLGDAHLSRGDRLEAMPHLLNGAPDQGRELLEALVAEADAQLNLPRWQDILQAARGSASSTGADLAEFIAAHTAYLNARSLYLTDYYQSALFLEPPRFREAGLEFISGQGPGVWHIIGPGGTGKTMQLRWLVSRLWVPQPARIPCARVDFDTIAPAMCARYPFLVFIAAADQLGRQLPNNPFSRLLRDYEPWLRLMTRGADPPGGEEALPTAHAARAAREVPRIFAACCQATTGTSIVVILDTLEELWLRYPTETATLIEQFRDVLGLFPGLRLVFSGRYEIPAVGQLFTGVRPQLATPFSVDQSRAYLGEIRGITDEGRQDDLIQRAGGLPYVLAMYADLVTAAPAVALDDIGPDLEPRLVYLAERIIDRIPEPLVRWLLRYGWVPRRLTRAYVRDVLAPFVIRVSSGERELDDPMLDPITNWLGRPLFPTDLPDLQAELDRAWETLKAYASASSWVTGLASDPDTVLLKAEMLAPMRAVLARRPVLRELHLQSAEFYRARAEADPGSRSRWLGETLYHLAQAASPDLVSRWQEFADQAREAGDYRELADLSAEVMAPEYAEGDLVPRPLRIEAQLWRAYAAQAEAVRLLQGGPYARWRDDPLWADVRREHAVAERALAGWAYDRPDGRRGLLSQAERLVRAALAFTDTDPRAAWQLTEGLIDLSGDIGICALALRVAVAPQAGQDAIESQERLTYRELDYRRPVAAAASAEALAARLVSAGQVDQAVSVVDQVSAATGQLADTRLQLLIEQGTPSAALRDPDPPGLSPEQALAVDWRRILADLALRQPERALDLLHECEGRLGRLRDTESQLRERAFFLELTGMTHGVLLRLDLAAAAFEQSASLWRELGHPAGHLRSRRHHAEVLLHDVGDVSGARRLLDGLSVQLDDGEESAAVLRLRVQALVRSGDPSPAAELARRLLLRAQQGPEPRHRDRVLAAIAALTATKDIGQYGPPLLDSLRHVRPGTARLRLLEQLQWCPAFPGDPLMWSVLREVATADPGASMEDRAVHDLQRAYVARACDHPRLDEWLMSALNWTGPSYLACEVVRCFPDWAPERAWLMSEQYLSSLPFPGGTLAAMVHLRQAWRERSAPPAMDRLLDLAEGELDAAGRPSRWLAEYYELRGFAALDRGDGGEAVRQFRSARVLQARLGNARAVRALDERGDAPDDRGDGLPRLDPDLLLSTAPGAHERETIVRSLPGGQGAAVPDLGAMASAIARAAAGNQYASSSPVRVESPELDVIWPPWELVADRVYRALPAAGSLRRDIAWLRWVLDTRAPSLSADLQEGCRRVIDGQDLVSPELREQVESMARPPGRRPRVIIVKGTEEAEASWRYSQQERGLSLRSSYLSAGWDAEELTTAAARELNLGRLLARRGTDVIHLTARMETSGTLSWLDTSEERVFERRLAKSQGNDTGIFATDVVGWLAEMSRVADLGAPPVVVLDPVAPSLVADPDLLAGRNRFAASVYLDGMAMAVVATGLVGRNAVAAQQAWLDGVARGDPLEEVVRGLRQVADPAAPPALFAPSSTFTISLG